MNAYTGLYSFDKCRMDAKWKYVRENCGCDAFNAPSTCEVGPEFSSSSHLTHVLVPMLI